MDGTWMAIREQYFDGMDVGYLRNSPDESLRFYAAMSDARKGFPVDWALFDKDGHVRLAAEMASH